MRLDAADFRRYLEELRPTEVEQAMRFCEIPNRMTLLDLRAAVMGAGLETSAIIPWFDRKHTQEITSTMPARSNGTYPAATLEDLLATFVSVVARKPCMTQRPAVTLRPATAADEPPPPCLGQRSRDARGGLRPDPIAAEDHRRWLADRLRSTSGPPGRHGGRRAHRPDPAGPPRRWPGRDRHRGGTRGARPRIGHDLLRAALEERRDDALRPTGFVARIRPDNAASIALFTGAGFHPAGVTDVAGWRCLLYAADA